jgi:prepilin-type N-terminal cleavage/methylation domain-containing protein
MIFSQKKNKKNKHSDRLLTGFTLIELMMSIFIIAVLASVIAANTGYGRRRSDLRNSAAAFVSNLRKAQSMALAGTTIQGCNDSANGSVGISLEQGSNAYFLYTDTDGDEFCFSGCDDDGPCGAPPSTSTAEWFEKVLTKRDIVVGSICSTDLSSGPTDPCPVISSAKASILFTAPDPVIQICDGSSVGPGDCTYRSITVFFSSNDPLIAPLGVTVDTSGRIEY